MMDNEFGLEPFEGHEEFIRDWWSPRKAFYGSRRSGKTTVLLCELNRFLRNDLDCLWVSSTNKHSQQCEDDYATLFGERPQIRMTTYDLVKKGSVMGEKYDAILMDEFQETAFHSYTDFLIQADPIFVRASVCTSSLTNPNHYLNDEPGFFDSVYRE